MNVPAPPSPPPFAGWWRPATRGGRIALLVASLWPLVYVGLFIVGMVVLSATLSSSGGQPDPEQMPPLMAALFAGHCLTMLLMFGMIAVYVVSVVRNPKLDPNMRILWVLLLFFGNLFVMPVYWYLYMWRDETPAPA